MPDDAQDPSDSPAPDPLTTKGELIAAAALVIGAFVLIGGILLFVGATGTDNPGPSPTLSGAPSGSVTAAPTERAFPIVPQNPDEEAINELARRSIELLPEGRWPDLYDDFTNDFQARCKLEEFTQAGVSAADGLGENLSLLAFKGLRELNITEDSARAVLVGELRGQSEYEVEAFFAFEDGVWKISPAPGSVGCSSFNRLAA